MSKLIINSTFLFSIIFSQLNCDMSKRVVYCSLHCHSCV